jgi:hypothetical protein
LQLFCEVNEPELEFTNVNDIAVLKTVVEDTLCIDQNTVFAANVLNDYAVIV